LALPSAAVQGDEVIVTDPTGKIREPRLVETGLKAQGMIEIISGLEEGELVLVDYGK
jgi:multidrug efflux pump subunit AcrA (membrane-fusion protein)